MQFMRLFILLLCSIKLYVSFGDVNVEKSGKHTPINPRESYKENLKRKYPRSKTVNFKIKNLFPNPILISKISPELAKPLKSAAISGYNKLKEEIISEYGDVQSFLDSIDDGTGSRLATLNDEFFSVQKAKIFGESESEPAGYIEEFQTPEFKKFIQEVLTEASIYLDTIGKTAQAKILRNGIDRVDLTKEDSDIGTLCWTSVHEGPSFHMPHVHQDSMLACTYYPSLPTGAGQFVMFDPRGHLPPFDDNSFDFSPQDGDLICFPSYLQHMVAPPSVSSNREAGVEAGVDKVIEPRVSISCNLGFDWTPMVEVEMHGDKIEESAWGRILYFLKQSKETTTRHYSATSKYEPVLTELTRIGYVCIEEASKYVLHMMWSIMLVLGTSLWMKKASCNSGGTSCASGSGTSSSSSSSGSGDSSSSGGSNGSGNDVSSQKKKMHFDNR